MAGKEYGRVGQKRYGGIFYEEFLPELRGRKGIAAYHEMAENDDIVGAVLYSLELLLRQAVWRIEPSGPSSDDKKAAEFVESCMHDMTETWSDTISEILTFLTYGWSLHEIVYKRRMGKNKNPALNSKYDDGLIGWQKLPIRAQESLYEWIYDDKDNLIGMKQQPPPDYGILEIPISKCLLFRTKSRKNNPEGKSILRNAYRSWYFKRRIQEIEGIGIERDLAGFPVIYVPKNVNIFADNPESKQLFDTLSGYVKNIRRDELEGAVLPEDYKLELVSSGGSRQFDTNAIINRYDTRIAVSMMADFLLLGQQGTGSYALSRDKTSLFKAAISTYLDNICETFNRQGIPALIDMNSESFKGITDYPKLVHGTVEHIDLGVLADFLQKMSVSGYLVPDEELEDYIRETANLPSRKDGKEKTKTSASTGKTDDGEKKGTKKRRYLRGESDVQI